MEFYLPPTGLDAVMPQNEFAPMIDWTHTNPFDTIEANRPRQADDVSWEFEQWIFGQTPAGTQAHHDPLSVDTTSEPSRPSLSQYGTAKAPARNPDIEKMAAPDPSSGDHHDQDDNDDAATTITTTTHISSPCSSSSSSPALRRRLSAAPLEEEALPPAKRQRRRRSSSSTATAASTEEARAKNRLAASKCRRKKKVEERGLEERQRRLKLQRAILREAADALVHEVLALKHEVMRHSACGFAPLDHYIAEAAKRGSVS